ncbi:MAG: FAD-binding oxidoreductase, partial [Beijerinckiaceae bacterium]
GLGSSVVGGPLPVRGGVVLDLTAMKQVLSIDTVDMLVTVEAGKNGGELEDELQAQGLTLGHSPQSLYRSTVGGWIATRASGQFSSKFGNIEDLVVGIRAVLADGSIVDFGPKARMAVGPDLRHLIIGSEGCLAVVTQVTLKCFPLPEARLFDTITFPSLQAGLDSMRELMQARLRPSLLRFYDVAEARHAMKDKAFPLPVMFIGTEGVKSVAEAEMAALRTICAKHLGTSIGPDGALAWMGRRFDFSAIEKILDQPTGVAETIEVSNSWSRIGETYEAMTKALAPHMDEVLGHFSHAYTDGISLYVILIGKAKDAAEGEKRLRDVWSVAMEKALATGATVSHHHGSGLARTDYVARGLGSSFPVLEQVKAALDPRGVLNPGKLGLN